MITWDRRKSSKYLWSTLVITLIVASGAFIYISLSFGKRHISSIQTSADFISHPEKLTENECATVCDSEECVSHSKILLDFINPDVDPCENFFQFACGNMFEKFDPTEFFSQVERYSDVMAAKLKTILDNIEVDPNTASGKMKIVYDSCMESSASDVLAVPTLLDFLRSVGIRDWPHLSEDFKFEEISLTDVIANFLARQEFGFIHFSTSETYTYFEDVYHFDLNLKVNSTLSEINGAYEKRLKPTRKYLVDRILNYFNVDPNTMNEIWESSQSIEAAVENLREEAKRMAEECEDSGNLLDCSEETANEWTDICHTLESFIEITNAHEKVNKNYIKVEEPAEYSKYFMKTIFPLLRNFTERSVANYLVLNLFINNLNELNFYFRLTYDKVTKTYDEGDTSNSKWKKCSRWIAKYMTFAIGYEYLKSKFSVASLQDVLSLSEESIGEAVNIISRQEWMSDEEKEHVKKEIFNTRLSLNDTLERFTDEARINKFYEQFHPTAKNFFHNVLQAKKLLKTMELYGLYTVYDVQFVKNIFLANAGGGGNYIDIFLGLLMPPTYTPGLQRFLNLVSFGVIFSHEFGHNLENYLIYHINTTGYFDNKIKCLAEQYSQFTLETIGKNLDGSRYRRETVADTIAISVIDELIEKYASLNSTSLLPSLSYSLRQQIYVNSINMLCTIHTKESDELAYRAYHPPARIRINGMMQNSKFFSNVFGCPEGSFMNPATKCSLL